MNIIVNIRVQRFAQVMTVIILVRRVNDGNQDALRNGQHVADGCCHVHRSLYNDN